MSSSIEFQSLGVIYEKQALQLVCEVELMSKATVEKLELWDLARLIPNARNARTHSDTQIAEIAGSIAAFGFMTPVLVDGTGVIIAGHGRVLAARQLRLDRVPVIVVEHLNDAEKRAYAIAGQRKTKYRGVWRVGWTFTFAAAAYNLVRMRNLRAAALQSAAA